MQLIDHLCTVLCGGPPAQASTARFDIMGAGP
jgi:hypothetical protein